MATTPNRSYPIPDPADAIHPGVRDLAMAIDADIAAVGSGDVAGPSSSVNNRIAVFDGTTGKLIKDGGSTIADIVAGSGGLVTSVFGRSGAIVAATNDYTWAQINKTTSSLADITTRNAGDLSSGTLPDARFPSTLPAISGANLTNLNATNLSSGTIAVARMPALTGDVTSTVGTVTTTIANNAVSLAKLADIATASFLGRNTAGTGDPEVLSMATAKTMLGLTGTNTGDVTLAGENYLSIAGQVITGNPVNLSGTNVTSTLPATKGGTGQASYAVGDLLYASTTTALSKLADVATGNALISGGIGVAPSWGKIDLTAHISNVLPAANGGTGQSSYTVGDLLYASGSAALSKLSDVATGNVLISGGVTTAPSWGKVGLTTHVSGTLGVTNGGTGTATQFTTGSVVFAGGSGIYSQDNSNLFWDDPNNRLGIGTNAPSQSLEVAGNIFINAATASLYLKDTSTGWQSASSTVMTPQNSNVIRSTNYTSGLIGWNISALGNAEFNNVDVRGAIHAALIVYNAIAATAGTLGVFKSAAKLRTDVVIPAGPTYGTTTVNIDVVDPDGLAHASAQVFAVNDILRMKDGLVGDTWFEVTAASDQTSFWRYTAKIWAGSANVTYRAGLGVADYGLSGQGFIIQTADQTNSPYLQMATHSHTFTSADAGGTLNVTPRLRIGNLNGSYGYAADTYGFGTGQYGVAGSSWLTVDATNGVRIGNNTAVLTQVDAAGNASFSGSVTATAGSIGGWVINSTSLAKDTGTNSTSSGMAPLDFPFFAGATVANRATAPFRVTPAGALTATNATITGSIIATTGTVGGWTIGATSLLAGSGSTTVAMDSGGANPAFYAGSATPGSAPFRVTNAGALTATNATITGAITSTSGSIAGWTINSDRLSNGTTHLASGFDIPTGQVAWFGRQSGGSQGFMLRDAGGRFIDSLVGFSSIYPFIAINDGTRFRIALGGLNFAYGADGSTDSMGMKIWSSAGTKLVEFSDVQNIIAGWTIGATSISSGTGATTVAMDSGGTNPAFYAGSATPGSAPFRVTNAGALTATNATITGAITATSGAIGGWAISSTKISSTGIDINSGASAGFGLGATPPTGSSAGTGLWLDKDGLFAVTGGVQTAVFTATGISTIGSGSLTAKNAAGTGLGISTATASGGFTTSSITIDAGGTGTKGRINVEAVAAADLSKATLQVNAGQFGTSDFRFFNDSADIAGITIGANAAPAASAVLDLQSTVGALLVTRLTTTQRDALTPANGMIIYNTTLATLQYRKAGAWVSI